MVGIVSGGLKIVVNISCFPLSSYITPNLEFEVPATESSELFNRPLSLFVVSIVFLRGFRISLVYFSEQHSIVNIALRTNRRQCFCASLFKISHLFRPRKASQLFYAVESIMIRSIFARSVNNWKKNTQVELSVWARLPLGQD